MPDTLTIIEKITEKRHLAFKLIEAKTKQSQEFNGGDVNYAYLCGAYESIITYLFENADDSTLEYFRNRLK